MLKKFVLGGMVVVAALLGNACGGDSSSDSPAGPADGEVTLSSSSDDVISGNGSSSSVTESPSTSSGQAPQSAESDGSSSSEKAVDGSSSSDGKASSSSGKVESSSSGKGEKSSSSEGAAGSSSSDVVAGSSSSEKSSSSVAESSSSVESSSSKEPSSSSAVESSSSVMESSSSESIVSSSSVMESSSSLTVVGKCKTSTEDKCIYGELYDERDGKTYKTVFMGTQEWMAENLNYSDSVASPNLQGGSWCYNNDDSNCDKYGRLYQWTAAIDTLESDCGYMEEGCADLDMENRQGICPSGWHLPDTSELSELVAYVKKYSPKNYWKDLLATSEPNGTDAFGFSLLYAGSYSNWNASSPKYLTLGSMTYLWSSMPKSEYESYTAVFKQNDGYVYVDDTYKATGLSVRCIKNSVDTK